ncbi:MAG: c-type cytochrome, partial [Planctomycetes bacterium]|nr:c-type cytochrome [Planctomycetota bacterium]
DGQNNLIHRRQFNREEIVFKTERVDQQTDFIRSPDIWFRPVNLVNAPDGTLYCCDMHREVLESIHIPLDVVKHLDLKSGRDHGRIFRIAPRGFQSPKPPRLSKSTTNELVKALESPHGWWRDTASRLLFERQDLSAIEALRLMAQTHEKPQIRNIALWTLEGINQLDAPTIRSALADKHPGVRENAVRLAESRLKNNSDLVGVVCELANDVVPRVRFQVAFSLGETDDRRAITALASMARRDGSNPWIRTAILSSVSKSADQLFDELIKSNEVSADAVAILSQCVQIVGVRNQSDEVLRTLNSIAESRFGQDQNISLRLVHELGIGLKRSRGRLPDEKMSTVGERLVHDLIASAAKDVAGPETSADRRIAAVSLLGCAPSEKHRNLLATLLSVDQPEPVQIAVVNALGDDSSVDVSKILMSRWNSLLPEVRRKAMTVLFSREAGTIAFLEGAIREDVPAAEVDLGRRGLLFKDKNETIRQLAEKLFGTAAPRARQAIVAEYRSALSLKGDEKVGQSLFEKNCLGCHKLGGKGHSLGPNLATSSLREPQALLTHILDPNLYVLPNYVQYILVDRNGRTFTGLLD